MSNVVKLNAKKQAEAEEKIAKWLAGKTKIDKWKKEVEEQSDKFAERLYDQVLLTDNDAEYEGIPDDITDTMIVGVIASVLVSITHRRNVVSPDALLKLVKILVERRQEE